MRLFKSAIPYKSIPYSLILAPPTFKTQLIATVLFPPGTRARSIIY